MALKGRAFLAVKGHFKDSPMDSRGRKKFPLVRPLQFPRLGLGRSYIYKD